MRFTKRQLENLNDAIFLMYMTDECDKDYFYKYRKFDKKVVVTAQFFIVMSKILKKHPQKLYPNQELRK